MLKYITLALAILASTANASDGMQASNVQVAWEGFKDTGSVTGLSGEYVAGNNFFVGSNITTGNSTLFGGDATTVGINVGTYFPIKFTRTGEFFGKVKLGYADVNADITDYNTVYGSLEGFWEGEAVRLGVGALATSDDVYSGLGITKYSFTTSAAWRITKAWELGANGTFGDLDAYGFNLRYNFL